MTYGFSSHTVGSAPALIHARDIQPGMTVALPRRALRFADTHTPLLSQASPYTLAEFTCQFASRTPGGVFLVGTTPASMPGHPAHLVTFTSAMCMEPYMLVSAP